VTFEEKNSIDPGTVVRMVQKGARDYRLEGPLKMRLTRQLPTEEQRFVFAEALLKLLGEKPKPVEAAKPAAPVAKPGPATKGPKR
jgi:transcription-repair coupling factor (superfamily II helicase)